MQTLKKNQIYKVVDLPKEKKLPGCKWIFAIKYKPDRCIKRYKARLVAKEYTKFMGLVTRKPSHQQKR